MLTFTIYLTLASGIAFLVLVSRQVIRARSGSLSPEERERASARLVRLQELIDQGYRRFASFFVVVGHWTVVTLLLVGQRLAVFFKFLAIRFERKFSRLIGSVRGQGMITKKGSASLFLTRIKEEQH